uniref:Uncharacterized protein n=1 Tax=Ditylum brightwellii TaxID=49249 RepID=A0A7S2EQ33_9STRA
MTTTTTPSSNLMVIIDGKEEEFLRNITSNFRTLWNLGSVVKSMREALLADLAKILSTIALVQVKQVESILGVLGLYEDVSPSSTTIVRRSQDNEEKVEEEDGGSDIEEPYYSLSTWLCNIGNQNQPSNSQWAAKAGAACASAFVLGQLSPSAGGSGGDSSDSGDFNGCSESEVDMGRAIAKLCTLATSTNASSSPLKNESSSSELLWPAIHRGLSQPISTTSAPVVTPNPTLSLRMERALLLLEYGCKEGVLGGMGNGELLVDNKTGKMMAPPPNIEVLLKNAVYFLLYQIELVTILCDNGGTFMTSYRSSATNRASSRFARLIGQLRTLHGSYPASTEIAKAVDALLCESVDALKNISNDNTPSDANAVNMVKQMTLVYAVLTCGADYDDGDNVTEDGGIKYHVDTCNILLMMQFELPKSSAYSTKKAMVQTARSVFQYAKWGALSCLLPKIATRMNSLHSSSDTMESFVESFNSTVFDTALDAVHAPPADALLPLFECTLSAAGLSTSMSEGSSQLSLASLQRDKRSKSAVKMHKILSTLFAVMTEATSNRYRMYMLQQICILIFRPKLLRDEYEEWSEYDSDIDEGDDVCTPIRSAFRDLINMAGTKKPHIAKFVISNISVAWLGMDNDEDDKKEYQAFSGLSAIPYRTDIADLLLYKESKIEQSSVHQELNVAGWDGTGVGGIEGTSGKQDMPSPLDDSNDKSIVRGFILLFLSKLPNPGEELHKDVLTRLLHFIILRLLKRVNIVTNNRGSSVMTGSAEYCEKIRAWQALCILSRFVTTEIASDVCKLTFKSMSQNLHGQIRYFIEIFTIQCARLHPSIFGDEYVAQVRRRDASLQHISSLMIIGGNLIAGRYTVDFFRPLDNGGKLRLNEILAGVLPWLSSTQGFSRAIAQLLVHKLIPWWLILVIINITKLQAGGNNWFLSFIFDLLEDQSEMKRL